MLPRPLAAVPVPGAKDLGCFETWDKTKLGIHYSVVSIAWVKSHQ